MSIGIYKITNPIGKIYIGQSINIERRFRDYSKANNCKPQGKLYQSFEKFGTKSHVFEIIEHCEENNLNERERYYQEFYNVIEDGLNKKYVSTNNKRAVYSKEARQEMSINRTGEKNHMYGRKGKLSPLFGTKQSEQTKAKYVNRKDKKKPIGFGAKVALANSKRIIKDETRKKISENAKKRIGEKNPFYGKKHSDETKAKLAVLSSLRVGDNNKLTGRKHTQEQILKNKLSHIGKGLYGDNPRAKLVFDPINGIYYECVKELADNLKISKHNLNRKLRGDRRNNTQYILA